MSRSPLQDSVFLCHSRKDQDLIRILSQRLQEDGLRVWSAGEIESGEFSSTHVDEGLKQSHVLILCFSVNTLGPEWPELENQTLRFRDPAHPHRRFILLRLDDTPVMQLFPSVLSIDWDQLAPEQPYRRLLEALQRAPEEPKAVQEFPEWAMQLDHGRYAVNSTVLSEDGMRVLTGCEDSKVRLWSLVTGECLRVMKGHKSHVRRVAWSADQQLAASSSDDKTIRIWDIERGQCLRVLRGHQSVVWSVVLSHQQQFALSCSDDASLRKWDLRTGRCTQVLYGHTAAVISVELSPDERYALSCSWDGTMRLWDLRTGAQLQIFEGHSSYVLSCAWSSDQTRALSGSKDKTVRVWDTTTGRCLRVLEGHTGSVENLLWSDDQRFAVSGSYDGSARVWEMSTGLCRRVLGGSWSILVSLAFSRQSSRVFAGGELGIVLLWNLTDFLCVLDSEDGDRLVEGAEGVQYTNAKVLLVGESGAGKTGLSMRLARNEWRPSDSTVGAWATQWKLADSSEDGLEKEIWLWDFGGQADQRLIHQLYMDETALTILVFDGQKDNLFETLGQWDRDLTRACGRFPTKLLVAGRVDVGGMRGSRTQLDGFAKERGYEAVIETSAKDNRGCLELQQAILGGIKWDSIPWRSSPRLFKRLKEEIVRLKDSGKVLMRFNELRDVLTGSLSVEGARFSDAELRAVLCLLTGPGVVWELKFGSWVLLQPEHINSYAQAVIRTLQGDEHERGCLPEERVLKGELSYHSGMVRLPPDEERFVLLAMHQTLVERGLCLREHTDDGGLLVFPSFYRRERPDIVGHPAVLVSYRFTGFLDDIYATLVVRLHHTRSVEQDRLWRSAADFKTVTGSQLGIKMTRRAEGAGEIEVYFDHEISLEQTIIFSKYVHEHLIRNARDVVRLRHYVCRHCGTPVQNRELAMDRLVAWLEQKPAASRSFLHRWRVRPGRPTIICVGCERQVPLWDKLEEHFASTETRQCVRELEMQSDFVLDNESKERALVGEVISTVALAGQICREFSVSDHGIDMEIEFKSDAGRPTGKKVYLQLKSGDSHLTTNKSDGAEIFKIPKEHHAEYWGNAPFPVLLVIRNSAGDIRWMEVRDYIRAESKDGRRPVRSIVFSGQRFDVMSVRRWKDQVLSAPVPYYPWSSDGNPD